MYVMPTLDLSILPAIWLVYLFWEKKQLKDKATYKKKLTWNQPLTAIFNSYCKLQHSKKQNKKSSKTFNTFTTLL